jgi:NADH/F420H2 dehydrogenase subunit C
MQITGTFIDEISHDIPHQNWGPSEWEKDFQYMQAAGIDTVIVIRCGYRNFLTYPSNYLIKHYNCTYKHDIYIKIFNKENDYYDIGLEYFESVHDRIKDHEKEISSLINLDGYYVYEEKNKNYNDFMHESIYNLLTCISGVDLLGKNYRFSIVYDFLSLLYNSRLRVKIFIDEVSFVPSCMDIYINADWWEREVWDMYGIYFDKHKDLRRILTDYGFEGYPMRKDFPLQGFAELRYDESKKRIVAEPIELTQEFRSFTFETPW